MVADTGVAHINCLMCKKKFQLGTKKSKFLISNWSRHVSMCIEKPSHSTTQTTLGFVRSSSSEVPSSSPSTPTETQDNEEQSGSLFRQTPPAQPVGQEGAKTICNYYQTRLVTLYS